MNDSEMMTRISRGDAEAFGCLYDKCAATLYAVLLKMLKDPHLASEALQDSFSQVWRSAASFDHSRGSAIAWLIRIGRSRALDRLRSESLRAERENEAAVEIGGGRASRQQMTGFLYTSLSELREIVQEALSEIPPEQREPIELAYYEGLSQREIAERLGQPLGTVKTRVLLGMKKLRTRLKESYLEWKA